MAETLNNKSNRPPNLLRGLFFSVVAITGIILGASWLVINNQIEKLVAKRTSEYAHSIAQIAANSSAEALLSGDQLQLDMLVENVAKDPYIRSATIYAEDGQIAAQFPQVPTEQNQQLDAPVKQEQPAEPQQTASATGDSATTAPEEQTLAYLSAQEDIPFVEKITYQQVTAGWFKVSLNRSLLENDFRQSLQRWQFIIGVFAAILLAILSALLIKYYKRVNRISKSCDRLIKVNSAQLPTDLEQWFKSLEALSKAGGQSLQQTPMLPLANLHWNQSNLLEEQLFVVCHFAMQEQQDEQTAASLSLAEHYLKAAVQAHGVQSQGDILSGCLIPFLEASDPAEAINEAFTLVYLITALLETVALKISVRAFIGRGELLVLENDHAIITGVSLSNRLVERVNKLAPQIQFGETVSLGLRSDWLKPIGKFTPVESKDDYKFEDVVKLTSINKSIAQQTLRQVKYLTEESNR